MAFFARSAGLLIEPVAHLWAAFCPASGETVLLNDESTAILELLESGPCTSDAICSSLAADSGLPVEALGKAVETCWPRLVESGLVRQLRSGHTTPE